MVKITDKEIERGAHEFRMMCRDRKRTSDLDVVCPATIALLSLGEIPDEYYMEEYDFLSEPEIFRILDEEFSYEVKACFDEYRSYFSEICAIGGSLGADLLREIIISDNPIVLGRDRKNMVTNPSYINKLLLELHHLTSSDSYLECGSGTGSTVFNVSEICNATGIEIDKDLIIISKIRSWLMSSSAKFVENDMYYCNLQDYNVNKITVDVGKGMKNFNIIHDMNPYNLKPYGYTIKRSGSASWTYALTAYLSNPESRVIAIMEPNALFAQIDADLRKTLVNQGFIEGIIELPGNLFTNTSIKFNIVIMSKGNKQIKFLNASNIYTPGRRQNTLSDDQINQIVNAYDNVSDGCVQVSLKDIDQQKIILSPSRYIDYYKPTYNGVKLGSICDYIERGSSISASELEKITSIKDTNIKYLMLKHIDNDTIADNLPSLSEFDEKYEKFCISSGEIIMSKNSPFKIAFADVDPNTKILANGNLYRIKVSESKMNPIYIMLFLKSEIGMKVLSNIATSGIVQTISLQDLRQVEIPNIPLDEQNKIADKYLKLCNDLKELDKKRYDIVNQVNSLVVIE